MNTLNSKLRILNKAQEKEEENPLSQRYKNKTIGKEFRENVWGKPAGAIAGAVGNAYQDTMWKARRGMLGPGGLIGSHGIDFLGKALPDIPIDRSISHALHNWGGIDKTTADVIGQGGEIFLTRKAIKATSKVTPKSLGISQTIEQLPKRIDAAAPPRKLIPVNESFNNPSYNAISTTPVRGVIPDFTYGGYLKKYPKGTGMTGAGSGAAYIAQEKAVTDALSGKVPQPGQEVYAMAYENVEPSNTAIHSVAGSEDKTALKQQIGDWLGKQKKNFNIKTINKEFGFINDVNKGYQLRIKTTGAEKYLTDIKDPDEAVRKAAIQHIKLEKVTEKNTNRAETQDIGKIDIVTENLDRMNAAWDGTKGIDPEVLNPRILRKVVNQGARLKDKITSELSKRFGISLQKEHAFGIRSREGFGQDAAVAQHAGETGMNNLLSKLTLNNAFSREAGYELGMPTHGYSQEELANMHPRRRAEMENLGALEVLTHYGMMSNDPGAFKAEIQSLKDQLKGIKEGDPNIVPTSPGRIVTDADLLKIQQLGHKKGMDRTAAAEMVLAQREALNQLLDAGL